MAAPVLLTGAGNLTTAVGSSSTVTIPKPTNTVQGVFMLAVVWARYATANYSTVPAGWMDLSPAVRVTGPGYLTFYGKIASASEPSNYQWASASGAGANLGIIALISGVDPAFPVRDIGDQADMLTIVPNDYVTAPEVDASVADTLIVGCGGVRNTANTPATAWIDSINMTAVAAQAQTSNPTTTTHDTLGLMVTTTLSSGPTGTKRLQVNDTGTVTGVGYIIAINPVVPVVNANVNAIKAVSTSNAFPPVVVGGKSGGAVAPITSSTAQALAPTAVFAEATVIVPPIGALSQVRVPVVGVSKDVAAVQAVGTAQAFAPTVTSSANVQAVNMAATVTVPNPLVGIGSNVQALSTPSTTQMIPPTATGTTSVNVPAVRAQSTGSAPAPVVTGQRNVGVTAIAMTQSAVATAPGVNAGVGVVAVKSGSNAVAYAPGVAGISNPVVSVTVSSLTSRFEIPIVTGETMVTGTGSMGVMASMLAPADVHGGNRYERAKVIIDGEKRPIAFMSYIIDGIKREVVSYDTIVDGSRR